MATTADFATAAVEHGGCATNTGCDNSRPTIEVIAERTRITRRQQRLMAIQIYPFERAPS